ncbi:hypothetical protein D3C86_911330 [compost metagenome]
MPLNGPRSESTRRNPAPRHRSKGEYHDRQGQRCDQESVNPMDPPVAEQRQGAGDQYRDWEPPGSWNPEEKMQTRSCQDRVGDVVVEVVHKGEDPHRDRSPQKSELCSGLN